MDSLVKVEDFEFSSDSPIYDFSAGFESLPLTYMPESDGASLYGFGTSPPSSLTTSLSHNMAVDLTYPPPPQLSNNHRHPRFLNRAGWPVGDTSQRPCMSPSARPYGATVRSKEPFQISSFLFFAFLALNCLETLSSASH